MAEFTAKSAIARLSVWLIAMTNFVDRTIKSKTENGGEIGMGLADWFRDFCGNIQVQDGSTISVRYKTITRRLNADFWQTNSDTSHSLYVGSYGRKHRHKRVQRPRHDLPTAMEYVLQVQRLHQQRAVCSSSGCEAIHRQDILFFEDWRRRSSRRDRVPPAGQNSRSYRHSKTLTAALPFRIPTMAAAGK